MSLYDDLWSGAGEIVDRSASVVVGTGSAAGGVVLTAASGGAMLINDAALSLDFKTEEEHAETEDLLLQTQDFGKGAAVGGALQLVNVVTTAPNWDKSEESEGFWDLFFGDTAEGFGTSLTVGTVLADEERTGEIATVEELQTRRDAIASWEDEILALTFVGVPIVMFPKLRLLLAAATPVAFSAISNAIQTGSGVANDVMQTIMVGLGLLIPDASEEDLDEIDDSEGEIPDESEVMETEVTATEPVVEEEIEVLQAERPNRPFLAHEGLDNSNKFVDREIYY